MSLGYSFPTDLPSLSDFNPDSIFGSSSSVFGSSNTGSIFGSSGSSTSYTTPTTGFTSSSFGNADSLGFLSASGSVAVDFGRVMIALGALTMILSAVQAFLTKRYIFNGIIGAAATCYMLQGALREGMNDQQTGSVESLLAGSSNILGTALAAFAFETFFAPIAWSLIFYTLHVVTPLPAKKRFHLHLKLIGSYIGYFWAFLIIICSVGALGAAASAVNGTSLTSLNSLVSILETIQFVVYGLWAFIVFAGVQLFYSHKYVHGFRITFYLVLFLLVLVNIGGSIRISIGEEAGEIADFVLGRLGGTFALWIALWFGPKWVNSDKNQDDVEQGSQHSTKEETTMHKLNEAEA